MAEYYIYSSSILTGLGKDGANILIVDNKPDNYSNSLLDVVAGPFDTREDVEQWLERYGDDVEVYWPENFESNTTETEQQLEEYDEDCVIDLFCCSHGCTMPYWKYRYYWSGLCPHEGE